jgi:hypothetical protein
MPGNMHQLKKQLEYCRKNPDVYLNERPQNYTLAWAYGSEWITYDDFLQGHILRKGHFQKMDEYELDELLHISRKIVVGAIQHGMLSVALRDFDMEYHLEKIRDREEPENASSEEDEGEADDEKSEAEFDDDLSQADAQERIDRLEELKLDYEADLDEDRAELGDTDYSEDSASDEPEDVRSVAPRKRRRILASEDEHDEPAQKKQKFERQYSPQLKQLIETKLNGITSPDEEDHVEVETEPEEEDDESHCALVVCSQNVCEFEQELDYINY